MPNGPPFGGTSFDDALIGSGLFPELDSNFLQDQLGGLVGGTAFDEGRTIAPVEFGTEGQFAQRLGLRSAIEQLIGRDPNREIRFEIDGITFTQGPEGRAVPLQRVRTDLQLQPGEPPPAGTLATPEGLVPGLTTGQVRDISPTTTRQARIRGVTPDVSAELQAKANAELVKIREREQRSLPKQLESQLRAAAAGGVPTTTRGGRVTGFRPFRGEDEVTRSLGTITDLFLATQEAQQARAAGEGLRERLSVARFIAGREDKQAKAREKDAAASAKRTTGFVKDVGRSLARVRNNLSNPQVFDIEIQTAMAGLAPGEIEAAIPQIARLLGVGPDDVRRSIGLLPAAPQADQRVATELERQGVGRAGDPTQLATAAGAGRADLARRILGARGEDINTVVGRLVPTLSPDREALLTEVREFERVLETGEFIDPQFAPPLISTVRELTGNIEDPVTRRQVQLGILDLVVLQALGRQ